MKKLCLFLILPLFLFAENIDSLSAELAKEKAAYEKRRNTLEQLTRKRWQTREKYLELLSDKKEQQQKLQQRVEQRYASMTLRREENLTASNRREILLNQKKELQEITTYRRESILQQLEKCREHIRKKTFPIDREREMLTMQNKIPAQPEKRRERELLALIAEIRLRSLQKGTEISRSPATILPNSNEPIEVNLIRFGSLFAIAMEQSDSAPVFYLTQTGSEETPLYRWQNMSRTSKAGELAQILTETPNDTVVTRVIPVDLSGGTLFRNAPKGEESLLTKAHNFFQLGGITMYPLALLLLWAVLIIIERTLFYTLYRWGYGKTIRTTLNLLEESRPKELDSFLKKRKDHFAQIAHITLDKSAKTEKEKEEYLREYLLKESPKLEARLGTLAVIAASAPLLGLFGTVTGMIEMFNAITRYGTGDPKLLASGISEALITTETGLAIAIPLLLIHNMLRNRKNRLLADLDIFAAQLLNRSGEESQ